MFDRSAVAGDDSSLSSAELVTELNKYVAGLGEEYAVQQDARGEEKIIMYENAKHQVPLKALNIDEIQLLRDCLTTYGFDVEATEREVEHFLKHGDYSAEVHAIIAANPVDEEAELEMLMQATGLNKARKTIHFTSCTLSQAD